MSVSIYLLEGLKDGSHLPLLEEHQVYLFVPDCDGHRFADLFRNTWNRLPGHATKRILRHWRATLCVEHSLRLRPGIDLVGEWPERETDGFGETGFEGNQLVFHKPSVDRMPDPVVEIVIAFVLARVFDAAIVGYESRDHVAAVLRQIAIIDRWGFSSSALATWLKESPPTC